MSRYRIFVLSALIAAVAMAASVSAAGQASSATAAKAASAKPIPRTASGKPNLTGLWRGFTGIPLERPARYKGRELLTDEEVSAKRKSNEDTEKRTLAGLNYEFFFRAQANLNQIFHYDDVLAPIARQTSLIIDPPDGRLPMLTAGAVARWEAKEALSHGRGESDSYIDRSLGDRCIDTMEFGRVGYWGLGDPAVNRPVKGIGGVEDAFLGLSGGGISEREDAGGAPGDPDRPIHEIVHHENFLGVGRGSGNGGVAMFRTISLDGRAGFGPMIRQMLGHARGHWEGDTLVIESANYSEPDPMMTSYGTRRYPGGGETLQVTEKYTLVDADRLEYSYTINDPETYSKPYTVFQEFVRDDKFVVAPELCHENNKDLGPQLSSARADEAAASDYGLEFSVARLQRLAEVKADVEATNKRR